MDDVDLVETHPDVVGTHPDELDVADRVGQELGRLLRLFARMRQQSDTAVAVAVILTELLDRGPQRVGEIAQSLGTDPSTVSRQVATLVGAGLVERRVHPDDGRAHLLAATESGALRCAAGRDHRVELIARVLAGWPDGSGPRLATLLGRFADDMQAVKEGDRRTVRRPGGEN